MTAEGEAQALDAAGRCYLLPPRARRLDAAPVPRPLPGAPAGLLGIAVIDRRGAMVWTLSERPSAWVAIEHDGGAVICGGDAVRTPSPDALPLILPAWSALPLPAPVPLPRPPRGLVAPARAARVRETYVLTLGAGTVTVPLTALDGIGVLPPRTDGRDDVPPGAIGHVEINGRFALLLDPTWCVGHSASHAPPDGIVAQLRIDGRQFALPVGRVAPGEDGASLAERLQSTVEGRALLAAAPPALPPAAPRPSNDTARLLLCEAGGARFAVVAADIATVIAPLRPAPLPAPLPALRGVVSHRGEVLPVHDLDPRLAQPLSATSLATAQLLRLRLARPVAVPVERVLGLRTVPESDIEPIADDPLVCGMVVLERLRVPVCRTAALAG